MYKNRARTHQNRARTHQNLEDSQQNSGETERKTEGAAGIAIHSNRIGKTPEYQNHAKNASQTRRHEQQQAKTKRSPGARTHGM